MLTPLMRVCIPPPLSEKKINFGIHPRIVTFYADYLITVLEDKILFIECETGKIIQTTNLNC